MFEPNPGSSLVSRVFLWLRTVTRRVLDEAAAWIIGYLPTKRNR
jgi:hypothetical protein